MSDDCPHTIADRVRDYASEDRRAGNCTICLRAEVARLTAALGRLDCAIRETRNCGAEYGQPEGPGRKECTQNCYSIRVCSALAEAALKGGGA